MDWEAAIARKYSILQQQANAQTLEAQARAQQMGVQSELMPEEAAARNVALRGQGAASNAMAGYTAADTAWLPAQRQSAIDLQAAQSGLTNTQSANVRREWAPVGTTEATLGLTGRGFGGLSGSDAPGILQRLSSAPINLNPVTSDLGGYRTPGMQMPSNVFVRGGLGPLGVDAFGQQKQPENKFKTGTSRVPGKGAPTKDTVPAKLAPGEAVLNAAAAEHLGRENIDRLNAAGAIAMGIQPQIDAAQKAQQGQQGQTPGFKAGTSNIPEKKTKPQGKGMAASPAMMAALMAMMGGGGGMQQ